MRHGCRSPVPPHPCPATTNPHTHASHLPSQNAGAAAFSPAYVRDEQDGRQVWRFMMPEQAPAQAAPAGLGDGAYKPLKGARAVVGVIGSAHVRGMIREWPESLKAPAAVQELL